MDGGKARRVEQSAPPRTSWLPQPPPTNLIGADGDASLRSALAAAGKERTVVCQFGAQWCEHCKQMLPTFATLAEKHPGPLFVVANVDNCFDTAKDVKYTPTFAFYRGGRKIDEFWGVEKVRCITCAGWAPLRSGAESCVLAPPTGAALTRTLADPPLPSSLLRIHQTPTGEARGPRVAAPGGLAAHGLGEGCRPAAWRACAGCCRRPRCKAPCVQVGDVAH